METVVRCRPGQRTLRKTTADLVTEEAPHPARFFFPAAVQMPEVSSGNPNMTLWFLT